MKNMRVAILAGLFVLGAALAEETEENVSLKLVVAKESSESSSGKGIDNVNSLLQSNLSYDSYTTLAQKVVPLKNADGIVLAEGVAVALSEVDKTSLAIRISRDKKQVLNAKITLRKDKPVILGGFSGKSGKLMVIVTLQ